MNRIKEKIISDLKSIGIKEGDSLLVHSSLSALGKFSNKAEIVTEAIITVLGNEGTLLMPTLSYETVGIENPKFDVNTTPSCVGGLTEYFRLRRDTIRSFHPTHSVAGIGVLAELYLNDHQLDNTPVGKNSPLYKLKENNGKILFLGCSLEANTSIHGVEELVEPPYLFSDESQYFITTTDGKQLSKKYRNHNFQNYEQRYDRIENLLENKDLIKGKVLEANCYLLNSAEMWKVAYEKTQKELLYFVDKKGDMEVNSKSNLLELK